MSSFHLTIVTPEGSKFDSQAERLTVRTSEGDISILGNHVNYVAALGMGPAVIVADGVKRKAAAIGGMLAVTNGDVRLIASTFEWEDEINAERAKAALARAEEKLKNADLSIEDRLLFEAAKKRALVRLGVIK